MLFNKHPCFFSGEEGVDEGETTEEKGHRRIRQTSRRYSEEPNSAWGQAREETEEEQRV